MTADTDIPMDAVERVARAIEDVPVMAGTYTMSGKDAVALATAAIAAYRQSLEDEWQPIETAPKDGTRFLAYEYGQAEYRVYECWWQDDFSNWSGWQNDWDNEPEPTHWRPLPAPPADAK